MLQDSNPVAEAVVDGAITEVHVNLLKRPSSAKGDKYTEVVYGKLLLLSFQDFPYFRHINCCVHTTL